MPTLSIRLQVKYNNALYVIDGVPMFNTGSSGGDGQYGSMGGSDAVADLNPDDIESISMMTGPSAAALYGSAAANGVVLVNTKKGKKEKISLTVSNSTTFSKAYIMPEMQNRYGTSSGLFSWGDLTDKRYDPKDFFNTGSNIINSITLSTGSDKNSQLPRQIQMVFYQITATTAITLPHAIQLTS